MERNTDPEIVVMDKGVADMLIHYARIGASEAGSCTKELERHIRKFNVPVSEEHQAAIYRRRTEFRQDQQRVKDLIRTNGGKTVFMKVAAGVLAPVRLLSVVKGSKVHVRVHDPLIEKIEEVRIDEVFAELPPEYRIHQIGRWKGRFVHNEKTI